MLRSKHAAFILAVILVNLIGCTTVNGNIPGAEKPLVTAEKHIDIEAPISTVWRIQSNIDNWNVWQTKIAKASLQGELKAGTMFVWKSSGVTIHSQLKEVVNERKIVWVGKAIGTNATHRWEFQPLTNRSTRVSTYEEMDGWLVWLLTGTMKNSLDESLDHWLTALKKESESKP